MAIEIRPVSLEFIRANPYQTRRVDDEGYIRSLAADIKANDLLEIPAAREIEDGHYQLAFGHNRLMAFRQLALLDPKYAKIPLRIVEYTDEQMAITAWSENEQRKNLNPVERARAVNNLILKFGWNQTEVGVKLNLDRSTISNLLRILRMPDEVLHNLEDGTLTQRQAMALAPYYDLTDLEKGVLVDNSEFQEFMALARNGTFDSDTIRSKISGYLTVFQAAGKPGDQHSIPVELAKDIHSGHEEKTDWLPENPVEPDPAPEVERDAFSEYEEGRKTLDPRPYKRISPENPWPPPPQRPPPPPETAPEDDEYQLEIKWTKNRNVIVQFLKNNIQLGMRFYKDLDIDQIPSILREMNPGTIQVGTTLMNNKDFMNDQR